MSEQERHETDESTDEPDVEAHIQDAFSREDEAMEREQTDVADERHRTEEAL